MMNYPLYTPIECIIGLGFIFILLLIALVSGLFRRIFSSNSAEADRMQAQREWESAMQATNDFVSQFRGNIMAYNDPDARVMLERLKAREARAKENLMRKGGFTSR